MLGIVNTFLDQEILMKGGKKNFSRNASILLSYLLVSFDMLQRSTREDKAGGGHHCKQVPSYCSITHTNRPFLHNVLKYFRPK